MESKEKIISITENWIEQFIIALNICPFAGKPYFDNKLHLEVIENIDSEEALIKAFLNELSRLAEDDAISNTLLVIHKEISFDAYLEKYYMLEDLMEQADLHYTFQLASFHPKYRFENTTQDDPSNYRNRSPFGMIHILRVHEVEDAIAEYGNTDEITKRNIELLNKMKIADLKNVSNI